MVSKPANSINANGGAGLVQFDGTSSFTEVTPGDYGVLISSSSGVPSWLANGTTGQVLTATSSGTPSWENAAGGSITLTGDSGGGLTSSSFTITGGTTGHTFAGAGTTLTLGGTLIVGNGGTGVATMTTAYAPVCAGTTATGALQVASTGLSTSGYVLTSNGSSSLPSFKATSFTVPTVASNVGTAGNPGTTSSASYLMQGFGSGWKLTPTTYGVIRITIDGTIQCASLTFPAFKLAYGTSSAPSYGSSATGTVVGSTTTLASVGATAQTFPFCKDFIITGLSPGTAYWFDVQLTSGNGSAGVGLYGLEFTAQELLS
jgi:hypothetical protein